jgi:pimeloyl-ACP methyl ester carboxylesterase
VSEAPPTRGRPGREPRLPAEPRRTAAAIPGSRFELIEDCGHTPQEERPGDLLRIVRSFLADLSG